MAFLLHQWTGDVPLAEEVCFTADLDIDFRVFTATLSILRLEKAKKLTLPGKVSFSRSDHRGSTNFNQIQIDELGSKHFGVKVHRTGPPTILIKNVGEENFTSFAIFSI